MRTHQTLVFGGLGFFAAVVLAQTLPSTLPSLAGARYSGLRTTAAGESVRRTFQIGGKVYLTALHPDETMLGPEWEPSSPLPIGFPKAEEIARGELRKLVANETNWVVTQFEITRFGRRANWYHAVTLRPEMEAVGLRPRSVTVLVDFSGNPGLITRHAGPQQ
jgi:hypothetical protein